MRYLPLQACRSPFRHPSKGTAGLRHCSNTARERESDIKHLIQAKHPRENPSKLSDSDYHIKWEGIWQSPNKLQTPQRSQKA